MCNIELGNKYKDRKGNEYYIVGINYDLDIVKFYENLKRETNRRFYVKTLRIENFLNLIENKENI